MPTATNPELLHHAEEGCALAEGVASAHFRLVWLAGGTASTRTQLLQAIAERLRCPHLSVGVRLSSALLELPQNLRAVSAPEGFSDLLRNEGCDTLCLDRLDILFETSLRLDAVALVKNASRRFLLVASWPGVFDQESLQYGPPDHPSFTVVPAAEAECPVYALNRS